MEVVYVPGVGVVDRDEGLTLAVRWILKQRAASGAAPLVVVPVKDSVRRSPVLQAVADGGVEIQTHRTFRSAGNNRPVLVVWPDSDILHKVTRWGAPHSVAVVLWTPEAQVMEWLRSQAAQDLSGAGESFGQPTISDPVVREALDSLTTLVNLGTGLSHPSDRSSAIQMFRILKRHRHQWDAAEVYEWAAGNGWSGQGAAQLREIAQGVLAGRAFRAGRSMWRDDIIEFWRSRAAGEPEA